MSFIRNLLALVGVIAIASGIFFYGKVASEYETFKQLDPDSKEMLLDLWKNRKTLPAELTAFQQLDPGAKDVYLTMWEKLKETGNSADASIWKFPLEEDVSWEDAEEAMASVANEHNIKNVGELPLSEQVKIMTGEKQRFLKIYQYCDPLIAKQMVDHSDAFAAFLPCRISMVEDKDGKFWLYALNMDMMIEGGRTLPEPLLSQASKVREVILDIMKKGAAGDF